MKTIFTKNAGAYMSEHRKEFPHSVETEIETVDPYTVDREINFSGQYITAIVDHKRHWQFANIRDRQLFFTYVESILNAKR